MTEELTLSPSPIPRLMNTNLRVLWEKPHLCGYDEKSENATLYAIFRDSDPRNGHFTECSEFSQFRKFQYVTINVQNDEMIALKRLKRLFKRLRNKTRKKVRVQQLKGTCEF